MLPLAEVASGIGSGCICISMGNAIVVAILLACLPLIFGKVGHCPILLRDRSELSGPGLRITISLWLLGPLAFQALHSPLSNESCLCKHIPKLQVLS